MAIQGCASAASEITPQYVSPIQYQSYSCRQIEEEASRISVRASQLAGIQDSKATSDSVAMGVGLVLFWPSLLFIKGDGQTAAELGHLKGEFDTLQQVSIQKNCNIQFRQQNAPSPKPTSTASIDTVQSPLQH
ncbi:hypothetical protein [Hyphomicrobium sp.]|uniref:hypothetical protein n=1 Tax=Hyphomicrobium sp. TaxID=82 RepID=UPI0025C06F52|nr:hypothetical protein [Hyphomicrobium sp.]